MCRHGEKAPDRHRPLHTRMPEDGRWEGRTSALALSPGRGDSEGPGSSWDFRCVRTSGVSAARPASRHPRPWVRDPYLQTQTSPGCMILFCKWRGQAPPPSSSLRASRSGVERGGRAGQLGRVNRKGTAQNQSLWPGHKRNACLEEAKSPRNLPGSAQSRSPKVSGTLGKALPDALVTRCWPI